MSQLAIALYPIACVTCGKATGRRHARYCDGCRWKVRGKPLKWFWTPERDDVLRQRYDPHVKGRPAEVAAALQMPRWAVNHRAAFLGLATLAKDRKAWTPEEDAIIEENAGSRHVHWLSRRLKRSTSSVVNRIKRLKLSRRWREGYTLRDLQLCFGIDHGGIDRWIRTGKLTGGRRGTDCARDAWCFTDEDLLRFIQDHPTEFSLARVDQVWFLDLLRSAGGPLRRAQGRPAGNGKSQPAQQEV